MTKKYMPTPTNAARIAGAGYILVILLGVLKVNFIEPVFLTDAGMDLGSRILADPLLFRIGIACEVLMYLLVVVLALALYAIVKRVEKELALTALVFRFGEAVIGSVSVILSGMIPLLLLDNEQAPYEMPMYSMLEPLFLLREESLNIVLIFVGIGGAVFCYFFYRSWLVPRPLAMWGLFTYGSMLMLGFSNILWPDLPATLEIVLFISGGLFEVVFGWWLLVKGINLEKWENLEGEAV